MHTDKWPRRNRYTEEPMCSEADWEDTLAEVVACASRGEVENTAWSLAQCTPPHDGSYTFRDEEWIEKIFRDPVLFGDHQELWKFLKQLCVNDLPPEFYWEYAEWLKDQGWQIDTVPKAV